MPDSQIHDPLGWLEELRDACGDPALDTFSQETAASQEARRAAYRLAVAIGHCRLFGIEPPDDLDGTLPATEAMAAAEQLGEFVTARTDDARRLGGRWDEEEPEVGEALCAEVLESRMEAWAAFVAIDEAYYDCKLAREPATAQFDSVLDRLLDALDQFDDVLQEPDNLALLSILTGTELLKNWKQLLAGRYREVLPWWLDGTLEDAERRIERELQFPVQPPLKDLPRPPDESPSVLSVDYLMSSAAETDAAPSLPSRPFASSLHWASPDGKLKASLRGPAVAKRGQQVALEFVHVDSSPAVELQSESVLLAGEPSQIDENGIARFDLATLQAKLRESGGKLPLLVAGGSVEWLALSNR